MGDERPVMLRDGRIVVVRSIRPDDADRLDAFFGGLSPDARRFRFFSQWQVRGDDARRMADPATAGPGAVALVATVSDSEDGPEEIVGDARSCAAHEGVAEMAMAIADRYQGAGLGRILLEELARAAAVAGVHTFTASVLADNVRMCRLLRSWGFAIVDRQGTDVVQLAMATAGSFPQWWPPGDGPKVLIEGRGWLGRLDETALRQRGYNVAVCLGPRANGRATKGCPVLEGESCPMIDSADAVVFGLPLASSYGRRLLRAHGAEARPVCVEVPVAMEGGTRRALRGQPVVPARADDVVAVVDELLGRRG